jgi:tetratricopeptide (TPR) repeat protein
MAAGVTACQQLYGGKPDKLQTPKRVHHEPEVAGPDAPIKYIDDCAADFHADPRTVRPQIGAAQGLTSDGDNDLQKSEKESDANLKVNDIKDAISKYSNALRKDPYNAEATLNLARAYDLVLRKGCALAMLKRLSSLAANPKFAKEANLKLDSIDDNGAWFKGYRKDAMAAAGK